MKMRALRGSGCGLLAALVVVAFLCAGLSGCGSKYVPGISIPPAPSGKTPPPAPKGKGGTYKPYTVLGQTYYPLGSAEGYSETGVASWYGPNFHGKKTANGERYDMYQMTAAHRILPMHTRLMVRNLDNGRTAEVRVNDRGPFVGNRVIDLSYAAANLLGVVGPGTAGSVCRPSPESAFSMWGRFMCSMGPSWSRRMPKGSGRVLWPGALQAPGSPRANWTGQRSGGCRSGPSPAWAKPNPCGSA
jgi:hypothetical protein